MKLCMISWWISKTKVWVIYVSRRQHRHKVWWVMTSCKNQIKLLFYYTSFKQITKEDISLNLQKFKNTSQTVRAWKLGRGWTRHDNCNICGWYWVIMLTSLFTVYWLSALDQSDFFLLSPVYTFFHNNAYITTLWRDIYIVHYNF